MSGIIDFIMNLFFGGKKKEEIKKLDKAIEVKNKEVKTLEKEVEILEKKKKEGIKEVRCSGRKSNGKRSW